MRNRHLSMTSKYTFFQKIDQLPRRAGMAWTCDTITITGNIIGEDGQPATEQLELWRRNPVECVRELIGNPAFREAMAYAPERAFSDEEAKDRLIDEMWTADWWWRIQVSSSREYDQSKKLTRCLFRESCHSELPLHRLSLPQTRQSCQTFVVTRQRGQFTFPLVTSPSRFDVRSLRAQQFFLGTYQYQSWNALRLLTMLAVWLAIACIITAWRRFLSR